MFLYCYVLGKQAEGSSKKEKEKDVGTVKRGRTGDLRVVRNSLM